MMRFIVQVLSGIMFVTIHLLIQGCNNSPVISPTSEIPSPDVTVIKINRDSTWESVFIKDSSEIPLNQFQAFYLEDSTKVTTPYSERVSLPVLNYSYSEFHNIPAQSFNGYWIGKFEFARDTLQLINLSQSRSITRICIDKQEIYFGVDYKSLPYTFRKGIHKIEIEYQNNWHTINFSVQFAALVTEIPVVKIDSSKGVDYWYCGVYQSGSGDNSVQLTLRKSVKPVVLFLSSYEVVRWNISLIDSTRIIAVYVSSYKPQSTVEGLATSVPVDFSKNIPFTYNLLPTCNSQANYCEESRFQTLITYLSDELKISLTSFASAYSPDSLILPDIKLDSATYKKIGDETDSLRNANRDLNMNEVFKGDTSSTWEQHFVNSDSLIPLSKFRAYYFDEKAPKTVVYSEVTVNPSVSYIFSEFHNLNAQNFAGYWIGKIEIPVPTEVVITVSQSHAETEIFIDKQKLYSGLDGKIIPYTLQPGTHLVEIQSLNNWHTIDYAVTFK